ncbi:hypothetical protein WN943_029128 [Citrus x changshan-huyou]
MDLSIDLRFLFPPLLNLITFILFLRSQDGDSWDVQDGTSKILLYPILKLQFWFLIPAVVIPLPIFLLTPIRLTLNVSRSISVSCGQPSVLLAISVVASLILAPFLFLVAYLCLIILSLCYATLASLFKRCFNWLRNLYVNLFCNFLIRVRTVEGNHIQVQQPSSTDDDENNLEIVFCRESLVEKHFKRSFEILEKSQDGQSWSLQDGTNEKLLYPILKLQFPFLSLAVLILLIFLLTAIRVPLSLSSPMSVSFGDHLRCLLAISTIASLILGPSLFLVIYLCLIILSLLYVMLNSLFKSCCNGNTAVIPPPGEQVEVEVGVEGDQHIQNLQPSPTEDLV